MQELDLDAMLHDCDPPGLVPPTRIELGLLTPRLQPHPSWGTDATVLCSTMSTLYEHKYGCMYVSILHQL
jgi:hypothetical protein